MDVRVIAATRELPESEYPVKNRRNGGPRLEVDEDKFQRIRSYRDKVARELDIDSTLIAPRQSLEMLSAPNLEEEKKEGLLLNWQRALIQDVL